MADDSMALLETAAQGDRRRGRRRPARGRPHPRPGGHGGRGQRAHRAAQGRARPGAPPDPPQRVPRPALGHPGGHDRARDPPGPRRLLPPVAARAAAAGRAGPARGRPGGVRVGRLHAPGRRPRPRPRDRGHQQERGEPDLRSARRRGRGVPQPAARGEAYPVPLARRHVPQGARGRPGRVDGGPRRDRGRARPASAGSWGSSSPPGNDEGSRPGRAFIRSLVGRGLHGVRLVISDDHAGW